MAQNFMEGLLQGAQVGLGITGELRNRERQDKQDQRNAEVQDMQTDVMRLQLDKLKDDTYREKQLRALNGLQYAIENGAMTPEVVDHFNEVYGDVINQGGPKGSTKRVVGAIPSPDGKGFVPELAVTQDGKTYTAPATLPNRDPSDKQVMVVPFAGLFKDISDRKAVIARINAERIRLGDNSPLAAAAEARKAEREHKYRMDEKLAEPRVVGENAALTTSGGKLLYRNDGGGAGGVGGGKGYNQQRAYKDFEGSLGQMLNGTMDATGRWSLPEGNQEKFQTLNQIGQEIIRRVPPGSYAPGELAGVLIRNADRAVMSPDVALRQAREEASQKAGLLTTDSNDFGGSREDWIKRRAAEIQAQSSSKFIERAAEALGRRAQDGLGVGGDQRPAAPAAQSGAKAAPAGVTPEMAVAAAKNAIAAGKSPEAVRQRLQEQYKLTDEQMKAAGL